MLRLEMAGHFLLSPKARNFTLADVERLSEDQVHALFAQQRWSVHGDGKQVCPECGAIDSHYVVHRRRQWRCKAKGCARTFSVTTGTKLQDHKLPLKKILQIIVIYTTAVKGISASQLARTVGVAYQTAFVLLHKLREGLLDMRNLAPLEGHVEVDGGHFSGAVRKDRVKVLTKNNYFKGKFHDGPGHRAVMVFRQLSPIKGQGAERTIVEVAFDENRKHVDPLSRTYIRKGTVVHTDGGEAFLNFAKHWTHHTVIHKKEFCTADGVNNNQAESYFARLRRLVRGQIHRMTPKYMLDYANEIAWREDVRRLGSREQLGHLLHGCLE
ncbi:MAG: IS1595 family transposase, partial [Burkholderiaceae bacterium]|nr:IS1595 family transposase [Burkholderiaceae bacterium]